MIYISSIGISFVLCILIVGFMVRAGYFSFENNNHIPLKDEEIVIPNGDNDSISEKETKQNTDAEKTQEDLPKYDRIQSIILITGSFILSVLINFLLYEYLIVSDRVNNPFQFVKMEITAGIVFCAAMTDYKRHKIPNAIIAFGIVCRVIIYVLEFIFAKDNIVFTLKNDGVAFLIGFVMLFIVAIISRGALGFGDVKLFGIIGLMIGSSGVFATLFLSLLINSVIALILIAAKKKTFKSSLPMAPFICAGYSLVCILGTF